MTIKKQSQKQTIIAPMGDHMDTIYVGLKELSVEKIILISSEKTDAAAERVKTTLEKMHVPTHVIHISGTKEIEVWENTFKAISSIDSSQTQNNILVNVATGDSNTRCAATTAAFANGLQAFSVSEGKIMMLPFMKFSYYKLIPDKKMKILRIVSDKSSYSSFEELSKKTGMSPPLISYHINGNLKTEGLRDMGLVEIKEDRNKMAIELSTLGRMVVGGFV